VLDDRQGVGRVLAIEFEDDPDARGEGAASTGPRLDDLDRGAGGEAGWSSLTPSSGEQGCIVNGGQGCQY
jgi:hypothetical protein